MTDSEYNEVIQRMNERIDSSSSGDESIKELIKAFVPYFVQTIREYDDVKANHHSLLEDPQ